MTQPKPKSSEKKRNQHIEDKTKNENVKKSSPLEKKAPDHQSPSLQGPSLIEACQMNASAYESSKLHPAGSMIAQWTLIQRVFDQKTGLRLAEYRNSADSSVYIAIAGTNNAQDLISDAGVFWEGLLGAALKPFPVTFITDTRAS